MKLKPLGDRLIVRMIEEDETTASGIVVPDTAAEEKPQKGRVIAVGEGNYDSAAEKRVPLRVAEGDEVLYRKYGGTEVKVDGEQLLVLREADVLASAPGNSDRHVRDRRTDRAEAADVAELREGVAVDIERLRELAR